MKYLMIVLLILFSGCATTSSLTAPQSEIRSIWSDPNMRVMIDPTDMDHSQYMALQTELVHSHKYTVVDRGMAFNAVKKEQHREHRSMSDRFENKEKWAHWGRLYGVGSIILPFANCVNYFDTFWGKHSVVCKQYLQMVDASTAEIIIAVEASNEAGQSETPDWKDAVAKLNDEYPKYFGKERYQPSIRGYQQLSEQGAKKAQRKHHSSTNGIQGISSQEIKDSHESEVESE